MRAGADNLTSIRQDAVLLADPDYQNVSANWFTPQYWGEKATPVTAGGRGGAWFVKTETTEMVLRHYLRGGMMARFSERGYVFTGFHRARSLAEFRLLQTLGQRGLPVPKAIAAYAARYHGLWYEAAILVERIPAAEPFPESPELDLVDLWQEVGRVVRRFHNAGLDHVDLNCDNILVAQGQVYLIDFDRCRLRAEGPSEATWKRANLNRLRRSVEKRCQSIPEKRREQLWKHLVNAYRW